MDEAKELKYQGMQSEEDVMPKVKYEDIPEERRKKWAGNLATFAGVVSNDDEFEEWLAVWMRRSMIGRTFMPWSVRSFSVWEHISPIHALPTRMATSTESSG